MVLGSGVTIAPAVVLFPVAAERPRPPTSYSRNAALPARFKRMARLIERATTDEFRGVPSWNVTPDRRWYV